MGLFSDIFQTFGAPMTAPEERGYEEQAAGTAADLEVGRMRFGPEGTERYGMDIQERLGELRWGEGGVEERKLDITEMLGLEQFKTQRAMAPRAYGGQGIVAKELGAFLGERMGEGLTTREKDIMRGAGRRGILQAAKSATSGMRTTAAGQGLRGGAVAAGLQGIQEAKIPAFGKLEMDIETASMEAKRRRIAEGLGFLSLKAAPTAEQLGV